MRPTAVIDLAYAIFNCTDAKQRQELRNSCPKHLRKLLQSNVLLMHSQSKMKSAKQRAQKIVEQRRAMRIYQANEARKSQNTKTQYPRSSNRTIKPVIQSVGMKNCQNLRSLITGGTQ